MNKTGSDTNNKGNKRYESNDIANKKGEMVKGDAKIDETSDEQAYCPTGWERQVVKRKTGRRSDIYFFSPEGHKFRSRIEIANYLVFTKSHLDIGAFVFNTGIASNKRANVSKTSRKRTNVAISDHSSQKNKKSKTNIKSKATKLNSGERSVVMDAQKVNENDFMPKSKVFGSSNILKTDGKELMVLIKSEDLEPKSSSIIKDFVVSFTNSKSAPVVNVKKITKKSKTNIKSEHSTSDSGEDSDLMHYQKVNENSTIKGKLSTSSSSSESDDNVIILNDVKLEAAETIPPPTEQLYCPKGWFRKAVMRKAGKTAGKYDVHYYSPEGKRFRSAVQIKEHLARTKSHLKIEDFVFNEKIAKKLIPKKSSSRQ